MERKPILLESIARCFELETNFLESFEPSERARSGTLEDWAPKDVLAHNAVWKARLVDNLEAVSRGETGQQTEDFDHENAIFYQQHQEKSWQEVLEFAKGTHEDFSALVEQYDEEALASTGHLPWHEDRPLWRLFIGQSFIHPIIHLSDYYRQHGQSQRSAELVGEMADVQGKLDDSDEWQGIVKYNKACHYSLLGHKDEAIESLRAALELTPSLTEWSRQDPDLEPLHGDPAYEAIYEEQE